VFVTTLVYKLVLFSPRLCRGKGGTNAHVKKSLGGIANNEGYEASRSWDEEDERIKRVEIVSEGSLLVVWNYTTVGQNHTTLMTATQHSPRNVQRFTSNPWFFHLNRQQRGWLRTVPLGLFNQQLSSMQHGSVMKMYARESSTELTLSIVAL
jgi:hypothetical protein